MTSKDKNRFPEERRLASVMFADVHGFTKLSEKLDFETVSDLIKEVWLKLDTVIEDHEGYIDKHMGDGVMAMWGAPFACENDAEQAVAAGLTLQSSLKEFASEYKKLGAGDLKLRIGVHTGPVFAGYVGIRDEYTVMGDTVNIAKRLEQSAEPGTVLISANTYHLIRGTFKVRRLTPKTLRGRTAPLSTFVVEDRITQLSRVRYRSEGGLDTCMVAREKELEQLFAFYQQSKDNERPLMVLVTGDAGIGKSRLLMEFTNQLELDESTLTLVSARALAQASRIPFYLWKSLWHNRFGIQRDDPAELMRKKYTRSVQNMCGQQIGEVSTIEIAHLIGSITGVEWPGSRYLKRFEGLPEKRVERAYELTFELLRRASARNPIVLMLDDLHFADNGSLDLLASLFRRHLGSLNLYILGGARPELLRRQPAWQNVAQVIHLQALPTKPSTVAQAYPDLHQVPEIVLTELANRSDGNPYFLEEIVKSLIESNLMDTDTASEDVVAQIRAQPPESLRSMLQARLDALSRESREVALMASVVGRVFWVGAVIAASRTSAKTGTGFLKMPPDNQNMTIKSALQELVKAELAFPRADIEYSNEQEYIFKHTLLRDVAYQLIPHKYRKQYHHAIARWMARQDTPEFKVVAADHYEKSGSLAEAIRQYEHAADYINSLGVSDEAEWLTNRAELLRERINGIKAVE